jgi:hypothetical protein
MSRRDLLGTAGAAGLAAVGVALLPEGAEAGLGDYPSLSNAHDSLLEAKKALQKGKEGFGGHRVKALQSVDDALEEIRLAVKFADGK